MNIPFIKMNGLGNDFVILGQSYLAERFPAFKAFASHALDAPPSSKQVRLLANRNLGVGCDQLIWLTRTHTADIFMSIFNADGNSAEICGNATRCVAWLLSQDRSRPTTVSIETVAGILHATVESDDTVKVKMGPITLQDIADMPTLQHHLTLTFEQTAPACFVTVWNPHLVLFPERLTQHMKQRIGKELSQNKAFPQEVNVGFVESIGPNHLSLNVYERGTGLTLACGSGACAATYAALQKGLVSSKKIRVTQPGGTLLIETTDDPDSIFMIGPVTPVFQGCLYATLLQDTP